MNKFKNSVSKRQQGFSLVELLIVMVIFGKLDSSKVNTAEAQMDLLATALDTYRLDVGQYPESLQGLRVSDDKRWDGPYLPKDVPMDPWDNPYEDKRTSEGFELSSLGRDGKEGGTDIDADIIY